MILDILLSSGERGGHMKRCALLMGCLAAGWAAAQEDQYINTVLVPETQTVYVGYDLELQDRFQFRTSLNCKGTPAVKSVVLGGAYGDLSKVVSNPDALTQLADNAVLTAEKAGFTLEFAGDNTLRFFCEGASLKTDFSKARRFGGNIELGPDEAMGGLHLQIPLQARLKDDLSAYSDSANIRYKTVNGRVVVSNVSVYKRGDDPEPLLGVGGKLYQTFRGSSHTALTLPASGVLDLYYPAKGGGWLHTAVDFKKSVFFSMAGKKPAGPVVKLKQN
jgi:hypothetical protein